MDKFIESVFQATIYPYYSYVNHGVTKMSLAYKITVPEEYREIGLKLAGKNNNFAKKLDLNGIHPAQMKYIARGMFLFMYGKESMNGNLLARVGFSKLNKTRYQKLQKKIRAPFARDVLHAFYNRTYKPNWLNLFNSCFTLTANLEDKFRLTYWLAKALQDAMVPQGSEATLPNKYRTTDVIQGIKAMRSKEDLSSFLLLGDALYDAGYPDGPLLEHYRDFTGIFTLGSWIFRATGNLEYEARKPSVDLATSATTEVPD